MKFKNSIAARALALFCACFLLLTAVDLVVPGEETAVFDNVIRLHVIADGDSQEQQRVKLLVRDAIIRQFGESGYCDFCEASGDISSRLGEIEAVANGVLASQGAGYGARAVFGREHYPVRDYGDFSLPAGEYTSLRVILGSGEGQNWWCVMFPPICFGACGESFAKAGIGRKAARVFTDKKYTLRFKLLELLG